MFPMITGATKTGPDATSPPPPLSVKTWGGGGGWLEGLGGGGVRPVGGPTRDPQQPHATSRGDVCLGRVWGSC